MALSIFTGDACTVNEIAQINVLEKELSTFQQGHCAEARVLLNGVNDKPWTMYVKFEVVVDE